MKLENERRQVEERRTQQTAWRKGRVNTTELNIRSSPGVNTPVIAKFRKGDMVYFEEKTVEVNGGVWVTIVSQNGNIRGWANRKYIDP